MRLYTYFNRVPRSHDPLLVFVHVMCTAKNAHSTATRSNAYCRGTCTTRRRVRLCAPTHQPQGHDGAHTPRGAHARAFFSLDLPACVLVLWASVAVHPVLLWCPAVPAGSLLAVCSFSVTALACRCARLLMCSSLELFLCSRRPRPRHGFPCACLSPRLTTRRTQL